MNTRRGRKLPQPPETPITTYVAYSTGSCAMLDDNRLERIQRMLKRMPAHLYGKISYGRCGGFTQFYINGVDGTCAGLGGVLPLREPWHRPKLTAIVEERIRASKAIIAFHHAMARNGASLYE